MKVQEERLRNMGLSPSEAEVYTTTATTDNIACDVGNQERAPI